MKKQTVRRRDYRKLEFFGLLVFVAAFFFAFLAQMSGKLENDTSAANLANFNAGYIISDYQMTDYNSMSEADIQNFLWSKGKCYNTDFRYVGTRSDNFSDTTPPTTWHVLDGHTVCLAEENMNGETAAHIIWQTAQDYKINPKVLIVLLQKETGLITDPIPNSWDYQRAAGYGCPDTAACSEKYYGFKNQIRNAAYLFRIVMDGNSSYYPIGNNYIQYNPNAGCGGSIVNIQNLATSALYRYTPYQPNEGALAAGYGTAYCGAYGNRNFYSYFEDWFGDIKKEGWPTLEEVTKNNRVADENSDSKLTYQAHIEHFGWMETVNGGQMAGTTGYGLRMEGVSIKLDDNKSGIEYRAHVAAKGWLDYAKDGELGGTAGESLQMEAIQIRLTGEASKLYDVCYRVHVAGIGWMDWMKNDEVAGTTGQGRQIEAIQIKMVKKESNTSVQYSTHIAINGWLDWTEDGEMAGTTGQGKQMEAIKIKLSDSSSGSTLKYKVHIAYDGWKDWTREGELAGTTGQGKRMEAIMIELDDEEKRDIYYRVHVANIGWMDWVKNGEMAGTTGRSLQIEAIEIKLVEK
ncbi:hypothetical protein IJG93_00975 [Candidatus Saccharibacteria bacterium]|nr:hypothetical protein [Candidatus Saccharibacteria bacterium]MBR0424032.1 hypothetical protein [Candidatus Saccharibacteria bacterium]